MAGLAQGVGQGLGAALFGGVQFQLHLFDIQQLLLKLLTALGDFRQHAVELHVVTAGGVVELDEFAALGQGKADALAPQDQLEADLVPARVDALLTPTFRGQQALFFVEANGAGGDVELAGEVGDAVGGAHGDARENVLGAKLMAG